MKYAALHALSPMMLRALESSLRGGALSVGVTKQTLEQFAGVNTEGLAALLAVLGNEGMTTIQMASLVAAVSETRQKIPDPSLVFELVVSGPGIAAVPTQDTAAVLKALFGETQHEALVSGYAIYNGENIFEPLHARMLLFPGMRVRMCLDVARRADYQQPIQFLDAFLADFRKRHWPWAEQPELFYYPRSLLPAPSERGSLHAKCVIIDRRVAFVTSANLTDAAQNRNIEVGLLIRYRPFVDRLCAYFDGLIETKVFQRIGAA